MSSQCHRIFFHIVCVKFHGRGYFVDTLTSKPSAMEFQKVSYFQSTRRSISICPSDIFAAGGVPCGNLWSSSPPSVESSIPSLHKENITSFEKRLLSFYSFDGCCLLVDILDFLSQVGELVELLALCFQSNSHPRDS